MEDPATARPGPAVEDGDAPARVRSRATVIGLCWLAIVVDGYDLIVYGTVLPTLISSEWQLTPAAGGRIGAAALVGMLLGALVAGFLTDRIGRRRLMVLCIAWFSAAMAVSALAPTPELFGVTRFVAGIGLGGVVPTAIALTVEFAPPGRRNASNALMFSGYSVGGVLAALGGIVMIEAFGWRSMFWTGALVGAVLVVVVWALMPESVVYLVGRGRHREATAVARRYGMDVPEPAGDTGARTGGLRQLLRPEHRAGTLLFWGGTAAGLLLVYGLNTWLAQIMRQAGYPLGGALGFLLALNLGAILGAPLFGTLADRIGPRPVVTGMFLAAAGSILLLMVELPTVLLLSLVAIAGACTIGTTIIVNSFTATYYPDHLRAVGLSWALGVGRIGAITGPLYGGLIMSVGWGFQANFLAFAIPAVIGAVLMALVPGRAAARS
ncbi:aromatic acid/H+ symport family MFS transporter [Actinomycetospora lutea]|uniref:MFS transporter n=1 Tax=Actinomycetospora lutea TaxID=663604 RepID=UPI0023661D13|nr:aromatic acid/H+ symport family MFS transporter [Actinomycetospora lutea]MDD7939104.1 aromatic acid/H+ symport family MFS transporter [Actinomycetospora lutea]